MPSREEKKAALRASLYATSIELFRSRGFDETPVRDIVTAVGVTEPTFFNYFRSKEAVLETFATELLDSFLVELRAELGADRPTKDKVRRMLASVADAFSRDRKFMATVVARSSLFWGATGGVLQRELGMYDLATQLFRSGQERGDIRADLDAQRLAETFTGAYMLAVANWLIGWWGKRDDLANRLDEIADTILHGCALGSDHS